MRDAERQLLVARSLEDFQVRRARGEAPAPEDYSDPLGEAYAEFLEILETETALEDLLEPPPEPTLPRVFGPYTLEREIGRGATGVVYEGLNRELGRRAAARRGRCRQLSGQRLLSHLVCRCRAASASPGGKRRSVRFRRNDSNFLALAEPELRRPQQRDPRHRR